MHWFLFWYLWAISAPIAAYHWGHAVGGERMRSDFARYIALQGRSDTRKQFDQAA